MLKEGEREAKFQRGIPPGWHRFICRGCGADYATSSGPLVFDPCGNCGTFVGYITNYTVVRK